MSPAADALFRLRGALAGCAVMLAFAGVLAAHASHRSGEAERADAARYRERVDAVRALEALRADVKRLDAHASRHASLQASGALGVFERTREVDRFERLARGTAAGSVERYTLNAPVPLSAAQAGLAQHAVSMHPLRFEAAVPHEEAFVSLWRRIADGLGGLATIEGCELALAGSVDGASPGASAAPAGDATDANAGDGSVRPLRAACTVAWYAIEPRAAPVAVSVPPPIPGGGR